MIFIANALPVNGGTTFLIRLTQELASRGEKSAVLLLREDYDQTLLDKLRESADVIPLKNFLRESGVLFKSLLSIFAPMNWRALRSALSPYGKSVHIASIFGLIFAMRMNNRMSDLRITAGVYHQNEFLYLDEAYFPKMARMLFSCLPPENVIFFNEASRRNYELFFEQSYSASILLPVGVQLGSVDTSPRRDLDYRIVSVGNLDRFKTYNMHVIGLMGELAKRFPKVRYDIYGTGSELATLKALARDHGVTDRVHFWGTLDYSDLPGVLESADLFVGSGTALVEAAAKCRPALIGVESIELPDTYGFLSEMNGLSYHEQGIDHPMRSLVDCIVKLFSDRDYARAVALACAEKAKVFSIDATADGFQGLINYAKPIGDRLPTIKLVAMLASVTMLGLGRLSGLNNKFADRRNQSFPEAGR